MDRRNFLGAVGSMVLLPPTLSLAAGKPRRARIIGLRLHTEPSTTRLTLDLVGNVRYQVFTLSSPSRVVIDIAGVAAHLPSRNVNLDDTPIAGIRTGPRGNGIRIVLDLRRAVHPRAFLREGRAAGQRELVLDLHARNALSARNGKAQADRPVIIAIDAGHGGRDPGAISASDHYEKYVALAIASKLYGLLKDDPRFQPTMTRTSDYFIPLHERVVIAHRRNADLFMSIHADAAPEHSARGASVYVLSEHGATSTMARWLADSENSADKYESSSDAALYSRDPMVSKVLVDMSMDATIAYSLDLGRLVIDDLEQVTRIHQHHVDQAAFAVLKSPDIPSLLVETGFMSNREDCMRLLTDRHQDELAQSLKSGITNYFRKYPLQGKPT
jgi:N-acetylmuramoyl-L-alanine amidase